MNKSYSFPRNFFGFCICLVIIPIATVAAFIARIFSKPIIVTPSEVAAVLKNFIDGTDEKWDFDDFTNIPIKDPDLDAIRTQVASLHVPFGDVEIEKLEALLIETNSLITEK